MRTLARIGDCLIGSTILYGAPSWSQTTSRNIEAVQSAQTKAARMVSGKTGWGQNNRSHRQDIMTEIGWRNVNQLIAASNLNLLKAALEEESAESINQMFTSNQPFNPRGVATIRANYVGKANRNKLNFEVQTTEQFNNLPAELRIPGLTTKKFKSLLKIHLLTSHQLPVHNNS